MNNLYSGGTPRTLRIPEYLDNLKAEFETLAHDVNMYKMQRDDYERKRRLLCSETKLKFNSASTTWRTQ
jgi:hypothetical protein